MIDERTGWLGALTFTRWANGEVDRGALIQVGGFAGE